MAGDNIVKSNEELSLSEVEMVLKTRYSVRQEDIDFLSEPSRRELLEEMQNDPLLKRIEEDLEALKAEGG